MPYTVQEVLTDVSKTLYDEDGVIWYNGDGQLAQSELIAHLNAAIVDIVTLDPKASTYNGAFTAVAGAKQMLPDSALAFLDLPYNLDSTGLIPGRAITKVEIATLNAYKPSWYASPPSPETRHVAVDSEEPRAFYCWPPCRAGDKKQIKYPFVPANVALLTDVFPLPDIYKDSVYLFVLWRAFTRNDIHGDSAKAEMFRNYYLQSTGQAFTAPGKIRVGAPASMSSQSVAT